ncbi:MAG: hypothetical protein ACHQQR_07970, partial [Gemmatimonadales bacterium]
MSVGSASWSFTEDDFGAITNSLQKFLFESNARCALLVDRSGQLVAKLERAITPNIVVSASGVYTHTWDREYQLDSNLTWTGTAWV